MPDAITAALQRAAARDAEVNQKGKPMSVAKRLVEEQLDANELEAEIARLRDLAQQEPHTAYLEAVQRACDERLVAQKHRIRELEAELAALRRAIQS